MSNFRGKLFLTTDFESDLYINPAWTQISTVDIRDIYQGNKINFVVEDENQVFGIMSPVDSNVQNQNTFWDAHKSDFPANSILFSSNPKITSGVTYEMAHRAGRFWDSTKETFYDTLNMGSSTRIENPFIIGKVPGTSNFIVMSIAYDFSNTQGVGGPSSQINFYRYTEQKNELNERVEWNYVGLDFGEKWPTQSSGHSVVQVGFSRNYSDPQNFTNVALCEGTWFDGFNNTKGRFLICGVNDSGEPRMPISSQNHTAQVVFISDACFSAKTEETDFDYSPEPEANKGKGFSVGEQRKDTNGKRVNTDFSPYGLNSSYMGHVILNDNNYSKLIASIFGDTDFWTSEQELNLIDAGIQGVQNVHNAATARNIIKLTNPLGSFGSVTQPVIETITSKIKDVMGTNADIRQHMVDCILSLNIFPQIFGYSETGSTITTVGGYKLNSPVDCHVISHEIVHKECTLVIPFKNYSFIGYEPYVSVSLYIPYIGTVSISPSVLYAAGKFDSTVTLAYAIDSYTGLCSCEVRLNNGEGEYTYCVKQGNCASSVPIIGSGRSGEGTKSLLGGISAIATSVPSIASGNIIGGGIKAFQGVSDILSGAESMNKQQIIHGSSQANIAAMLCPTVPMAYVTYKYASMPKPEDYDAIMGGMTNEHKKIKEVSGFCTFYDANLYEVSATQAVKEQILSRLKSGVII